MAAPTLIYCGGGNRRYGEIAIAEGFMYGSQLPETIYFPLYFADQDWKKPNREAYMTALNKHRPYMATVLDWERADQLPEVLSWAEQAAQYVECVLIVPKVHNAIDALPTVIGGKPVRLGYSVPTRYGGTSVFIGEFGRRPVHLLGGNPVKQKTLTQYLNVVSADGNMALKMANQFAAFFDPEKRTSRGYFPSIRQFDGKPWEADGAHYEAFRRSMVNIKRFWRQ